MASLTSILTLRLVDQITPNAARIAGSLRKVDGAALALTGRRGGLGPGGLAAMAGRSLLAAGGAAAGAAVVRDSVKDFAALDRRMTYVGLTAGATAEQTQKAADALRRMAQIPGSPGLDKSVEGLESLVAAGRSLPEAMAFLPAVTRTAVAANASVESIATTADALGAHFQIAAPQIQSAFDTLVEGGKLGKFELKDMARYLPSLAPAAAAVGLKGAEGLKRFVAVLQTIRAGTGTAEEAAASAMNVFAKMESQETAARFSKFGVDLRKEMALARKEGKDLFETFLDLSSRALKGDMSKLPQLFSDMEFARGMRALLGMRGQLAAFNAELSRVDGSTMRDFARVAGDAQDKLDRLASGFEEFKLTLGAAAALGALAFMERLQLEIRQFQAELEGLVSWFERNTSPELREALGSALGGSNSDLAERLNREEAERRNPALREEREARDRYQKFGAVAALIEEKAAKIDPRRATTGERVVLNNAKVAGEERDAAIDDYLKAGRRASQSQFAEPSGPSGAADLEGVHYTMGSVKDAMNMSADAAAAGAATMGAFTDALNSQAAGALAAIDAFVAQAKAKLSFSASPTIAPNFVAPSGGTMAPAPALPTSGAPTSGKQSRVTGSDARRMVRTQQDTMYSLTREA